MLDDATFRARDLHRLHRAEDLAERAGDPARRDLAGGARLLQPAGRDLGDADVIAARVVSEGYATVFAAGGDGTFVGWENRIVREAAHQERPVPRFGILALGTGNAVAGLVGTTSRSFLGDLQRFVRGEAPAARKAASIAK